MKKWLIVLGIVFAASLASAVYILPEMPSEPGPTPKLLLVLGYWAENNMVTLAYSNSAINNQDDYGPSWNVEYIAFDSIADVGRYLANGQWHGWRGREILGLWELTESSRIPVKSRKTTETIEKHIEVEERERVTDHYQIGEEEFHGESY
jgi:hypothetical protein